MKTLLIIPPSFFLKDQRVFPNLGILRIGALLKNYRYNVEVVDLSGENNYLDKINQSMSNDIEYVGITSVTPQINVAIEICNHIKSKYPKVKTIIGGAHVTMVWGSIQQESERLKDHVKILMNAFDHLVVGDGEFAMLQILKGNSPKIIDSENNKHLQITNLVYNSLPYPNRNLIDIESYKYFIDGKKATSLIGQMGCPFSCSFCGGRNCDSYKKIRTRSETSIVDEIDYLYKTFGFEGFMFYDDELNVNEERFHRLLNKLIEYQEINKIQFSFRGFSRADLLTEQQAELMYKAGFKWLLIGFESGSNKILQSMNKNIIVNQNTKAFEIARKFNLKIKALMSIGHPGESYDTIKETEEWLMNMKPDETDLTIITLYPGSDYFDKSIWNVQKNMWQYTASNGEVLYSDEVDFLNKSYFYKSISGQYTSYVCTEYLNKADLLNERNRLEIIFQNNKDNEK